MYIPNLETVGRTYRSIDRPRGNLLIRRYPNDRGVAVRSGNQELLALHDAQLRGRLPDVPPVGSVVEQDGPLIRIHYGTHGSIDYRNLSSIGLDELITRQRDAFAARGERGEWTIYSHDTPSGLPDRLSAAGFTRSWERTLLVAPIGPGNPATATLLREAHSTADLEHVTQLAAEAGPQRTSFTEFLADGRQLPGTPRYWPQHRKRRSMPQHGPSTPPAAASSSSAGSSIQTSSSFPTFVAGTGSDVNASHGFAAPTRAISSRRPTASSGMRSNGSASSRSPQPRPTTGHHTRRPPRPAR